MLTTEEIREELKKQGVLDYLEDLTLAITPDDWCYECGTHKHMCGHERAVVLFHCGFEGEAKQFLDSLKVKKKRTERRKKEEKLICKCRGEQHGTKTIHRKT